jgi:uncharacterized membrane protein (DUF4010 family)
MLHREHFQKIGKNVLSSALLLSMAAMLIECLLILFYFSGNLPISLYLPFALLAPFFILGIITLNYHHQQKPS